METRTSLNNKVVLITGAGAGVGAGVSVHLAGCGCRLVLTGRSEDKLRQTAKCCCDQGLPSKDLLLIQGDLNQEDSARQMVSRALDRFGTINVLVNAAGVILQDDIQTTSMVHYDTVMNTNVRATFHITMLLTPYLIKSAGCVINISSVCGSNPVHNLLTYGMSKAAIEQFTRTLATELGPKSVRVNCVSIGEVHTDPVLVSGQTAEKVEEPVTVADNPLCRTGSMQEVAHVVAFLASDSASFVTGVVMPVDGGWLCQQHASVTTSLE